MASMAAAEQFALAAASDARQTAFSYSRTTASQLSTALRAALLGTPAPRPTAFAAMAVQ